MFEPFRGSDAILAGFMRLFVPAGLCLAFSCDAANALDCPRGQILVVGRHACVSRETFQQYLRSWRTGKPVPATPSRQADRKPAKPVAETKPPPPKPVAKPEVEAAAPVPPVKPESLAAPKPAVSAAAPRDKAKPSSPFGELQVR